MSEQRRGRPNLRLSLTRLQARIAYTGRAACCESARRDAQRMVRRQLEDLPRRLFDGVVLHFSCSGRGSNSTFSMSGADDPGVPPPAGRRRTNKGSRLSPR